MDYKIELDTGSGWTEHEIEITSFQINEKLHSKLRPVDSTASIVFTPNQTLFNQLKVLDKANIKCRIKQDESIRFTGYLRNQYDIAKTQKLESLKVEIVSPSFLLKRKIGQNINYANQTVGYIINDLLVKAGLTGYSLPVLSATIPGLFIEEGKSTYHDIICTMLFEYGWVMYFNKEGTPAFFNLNITSIETTKTFDNTNTFNKIQQTKTEEEIEKVIVDWTSTKTITNTIVFSDTTNAQAGYKCYIEIPPNGYLGTETEWFAELDHAEGEVLSVSGINLDIDKDSDIQVMKSELHGSRVLLSIKNTNALATRFIRKLDIIASSATVKLEGENKSIVINEPGTEKIEEYQSKYLYTKTAGDELANLLANYYRFSDFKYKVQSKTNFELGDIVTISDTHLGTNKAIIIGKVTNCYTGMINYELEAVDEYQPSIVSNETVYIQPKPSAIINSIQTVTEAGLNTDGTLIQPINSNTMITDITPTGDGLYLTKSYIGLRKDGEWKSYIDSTGDFAFKGDSNNFIHWDGTKLQIKGEMILEGNSTITGTIQSGQGIKSVNYSAGLTGWQINGAGDGEFNNVVVRGTVVANNTSQIQGTISTGAIQSTNYVAGVSGFALNSDGNVEFNSAMVRGAVVASSGSIGGNILTSTEIKSSNYSEGIAGFLINNNGFAEFNNINVRGDVNSTSGSVGGWNITTDKLVSNITGSRIELNKGLNRVSIINTTGIEKVVIGYLEGLAKNVGSGTYTSSDYGFWVSPGDTINVDGPMKILNGDMTASDSSFKVFTGISEVLRLGSDSAVQGLHLYSSSKKKSITPTTENIRISTPSGYIEIGPLNTSWCHFNTDRAAFYFYKKATFNGTLDVNGNYTQKIIHGDNFSLKLNAADNSSTTYPGDAILRMWVSEPGQTWTGAAVARNMTNTTGFPRINSSLTGQMMNFEEGGNITYAIETSAGVRTNPLIISGTGITIPGTLTSSIATGTAPFIVTSTTRVANLNVATAGNADYATIAETITDQANSATITSATTATASTIAQRDSAGDITTRLFRSTYGDQTTISGSIAYRVSTVDNYLRYCSDKAAIRAFINTPSMEDVVIQVGSFTSLLLPTIITSAIGTILKPITGYTHSYRSGTVRVSFEMKANAGTATAYIYKNGVAYSGALTTTSTTFVLKTVDVPVVNGDVIEIWGKASNSLYNCTIQDPKILTDGNNEMHNALYASTANIKGYDTIGQGIVQSGSNTNGTYMQFYDGTQICYNTTAALASGTEVTITFPVYFLSGSLPNVIFNPNANSVSTSGVPYRGFARNTANTSFKVYGAGITTQYLAIGRWK